MRTIQGTVISTKMDKTIVVAVVEAKSHPKYHKKYKVTKKFYAHDEENTCVEGERVTIVESRPLSKLKRWTVMSDGAKPTKKTETKPAAKKAPAKTPAAKKAPAKKPSSSAKATDDKATVKTTTTAAKKAPAKKPAAKKPAAKK